MKIIKQPQFNICTCEKCGTVFQPEASDDLYYRWSPIITAYEVFARCPTCETFCETTVKKEIPAEQNTCVSCGEIIPEGRQVCPTCEHYAEAESDK